MRQFSGQDTVDAIHNWVKKEIVDGPSRLYDFGKHLFAISIGSIGLLVTIVSIAKQSTNAIPELTYVAGLLFIVCSILALLLTLPRVIKLDSRPDIVAAYNKTICSGVLLICIWMIFWLFGLVVSALALFITDC